VRLDGMAAAAGALLAALAGAAGAQQPPALGDYSVLGVADVRLGRGVRVVAGAVGATAGTVRVRPGARVAGTTVAATLRIARGTRVGRVFCGVVIGRPPLPSCLLPPDPVVDPALLAPVPVVPGTVDLVLPPRQGIAPLPPGSFDEIVVGRGGLLTLAGGDYAVRALRVAARGQVVCDQACRVGVAETVSLGPRAELGARGGLAPGNVRIDVGGGDDPPAFRSRGGASVNGTVFAPGGRVRLGPRGDYRGAFVGNVVQVGPGSRVRAGSAL
jgi:hypothetical protein